MILIITLLAGPVTPMASAVSGASTHVEGASVERLVNPDGTLNLNDGFSGALDVRGWNITLDSARGPILTRQASPPQTQRVQSPGSAVANSGLDSAAALTATWQALPHNGLNGLVAAIAITGSDVYVGGDFTQTSDGSVTNLNYIARFSGGTWLPLPNRGLNTSVRALAFIGSDLYVGGMFTQSFDGAVSGLNHIARFSGGAWSALPNGGLSERVYALAAIGTDLYAGGIFFTTFDGAVGNLNMIAKFSNGAWSALAHGGLERFSVTALAVSGSDLYVGGNFTQSFDGAVINLNRIAKYSAGAWSGLANGGLNHEVSAIAASGDDLYVGGVFIKSFDGAIGGLNRIAKYSAGAWSALPHNGLRNGALNYVVNALAVSGGDLYVGGVFNQTFDGAVTNLNNVARLSGGTWSALPQNGLNLSVSVLAATGDQVYVGGQFNQTADGALTNLGRIALLAPPITPPLIFVHGVAGSTLVKNGNPIWIGTPFVTSRRELSQIDSPPASVIATDALRDVLGVKPIYGPLLDYLVATGGYVEYQVDGIPARRTVAGCNTAQTGAKPNLFVFAYDWRVDNDANADKLKEYIGCVQLFYPGSKVNLLAHSMGGLVSRRYILKYYNGAQANNGHQVNALITIGSPFLGAPKLSYVLETGDFIGDPPIATGSDVKYAAQTLTAAHQLLPSRRYADVSGVVPLAEAGWDLDADGVPNETYSYDDMLDVMNIRYPNTPGASGDAFHSYAQPWGGQDDWSADITGVKYAHIYGVRSMADTIGQVQARIAVACSSESQCTATRVFMPAYTIGDGTVPARSATKQGNGFNYNAPAAQLFRYFGPSANGDNLTEHTGLTQNPLVQAKILDLITQTTGSLAGLARSQAVVAEDPVLPAHYLLINGGTGAIVEDAFGASTAPLQGDLVGRVPGVTHAALGDQVTMLTLAASGEYTITFVTTNRPLVVELTTGTDVSITQIVRFMDLSLPLSVTTMLRLHPGHVGPLTYDADADGSFESVLTPTVDVSGTIALDTLPPILSISATVSGAAALVAISALDDGAGVKRLSYSLNGTEFQPYTGTVTLDWRKKPALYIMADDNLANRSVSVYTIVKSVYLPVMIG